MLPDHGEGVRQMKHAYDKGINVGCVTFCFNIGEMPPFRQSLIRASCFCLAEQTFDTANVYSAGESEIILGKFLKEHKIPRTCSSSIPSRSALYRLPYESTDVWIAQGAG